MPASMAKGPRASGNSVNTLFGNKDFQNWISGGSSIDGNSAPGTPGISPFGNPVMTGYAAPRNIGSQGAGHSSSAVGARDERHSGDLLLQGVQNSSPWLSTDQLLAPAKQNALIERNTMLNRMDQQTMAANEIEYAARAAQGLLGLGDEAAMAAAYPGAVSNAQQSTGS